MSLLNDEKAIRTWKNGQNSPLMVQYLRSDKKIHGGATYAHLKYFSKPKKEPVDSIVRVWSTYISSPSAKSGKLKNEDFHNIK